MPAWCATVLLQRGEVLGAGAEMRDALALGHAPQDVSVGCERRSLVEDEGRSGGEPAHQPVPHHPAAGREEEQGVVRLQVTVQQVLLAVLQQRAADTVHDALRDAGRSRRIHDEQRGVERHAYEVERGAGAAEVAVMHGVRQVRDAGRLADVWNHHHPLHGWQLLEHAADRRERVDGLAVVEIAVGGEEHARRHLAEAVEHAVDAEVGRARRPRRAEARRREHRHDRLRQVRHEAGDPVTRADAELAQPVGDACHFRAQLAVRQFTACAALVAEHYGAVVVVTREQVLGEIEPRVLEPCGTGHPVAALQHRRGARRVQHAGELHHRRPELLALLDRPAPQCGVVTGGRVEPVAGEGGETRQVRSCNALRGRLPDRFAHRGAVPTSPGSSGRTRPRAWST